MKHKFTCIPSMVRFSEHKPIEGEVIYLLDTQDVYEYYRGRYIRLKTYPNYETDSKKFHLTNCKNCGAPLISHKCEYCGTIY